MKEEAEWKAKKKAEWEKQEKREAEVGEWAWARRAEITAARLVIKRVGETAAEAVALQQEAESSWAAIEREEREAWKWAEKVEAAQWASREACMQCAKQDLVSRISGNSEVWNQN